MLNTSNDPLIGSSVSHYTIVARLGGGGMGIVYKAADTKLSRTVALKFLPPQWSHDEAAKQRFLREAQAASATNHPNICVIHDISQTDDGRLFIVMAYYEGQTLKERLEAGPLPLFDALDIAGGVAEGLAKAHAQGVIHRDIKPGNLILGEDGVRIVDFGLATFADAVKLTIEGSTIGTVAYMSPEQARGEEADARSDIWALGVVLYEMLTGEVPFKGQYPEAVFYAIKNEPIPPLRLPAAGPETDRLETLVGRALAKVPEQRYQQAREMARDLRLLQGRTVPVDLLTGPIVAPRLLEAPETSARRTRVGRVLTPRRAIAAVLVLLAVAVSGYWWMTRPVVRVRVAIAPVANHTGEPQLDAYRLALTAALIGELDGSPNIRTPSYARLVEIVRRFIGTGDVANTEAVQAIADESGAAFVVIPSLEYRAGDGTWYARVNVRTAGAGTTAKTYETPGVSSTLEKDAAYRLMTSVAESIQRHFKASGPGRSYRLLPASARLHDVEALRAFEEGINSYELREYSAARDAFRRAATTDASHAMTHAWLARVSLILRQRDEAVSAARKAKQSVTTDTSPADAAIVDALLAETQGDYVAAEAHLRRLRTIQPDLPAAAMDLADFFQRQRRYQEAVAAYRDVLTLDPTLVGPHVDLCQQYFRLDQRPLGEQEAQTALGKYRRLGNRPGEAQVLLCLGDLQRRQGGTHLVEARRNIEAARDIFQTFGLAYGLSRAYQYLGVVAGESGNFPEAARNFEESLARARSVGNRDIEPLELMNLGVAYQKMGNRRLAVQFFQQSHDLYERNGDEGSAAEQEINIAGLMVDAGIDQEQALRRAANARGLLKKRESVQFEVSAMQLEASSQLYAGRHAEARRTLHEAATLAGEHQLNNSLVALNLKRAESYFLMSEYESARQTLEETLAGDAGRDDPEVLVMLGRVLTRLGDQARALDLLTRARPLIDRSGRMELVPPLLLARGEQAWESGNPRDARDQFRQASALWVDDLPDAASVEARCDLGAIDGRGSTAPEGLRTVEQSAAQARKIGRLGIEARCRIHQAQIDVEQRRVQEALAALDEIRIGGGRDIGLELQAQMSYWRSQALEVRGDHSAAASEEQRSSTLARSLRDGLPGEYRDSFAARPDIRRLLSPEGVRKLDSRR